MAEEKAGATGEIVKAAGETIKAAYDDALSPAAKQVGKALETVTMTVNVALQGWRLKMKAIDLLGEEIEEGLAEKLKDVPPEDIQPPPLRLAEEALDGLRVNRDSPEIREMFLNLLAASMNSERVAECHPTFAQLVNELSPFEAQMIQMTGCGSYALTIVTGRQGIWDSHVNVAIMGKNGEVMVAPYDEYAHARFNLGERLHLLDFLNDRTDGPEWAKRLFEEAQRRLGFTENGNRWQKFAYTARGLAFWRVCLG